MYANLNQWKLNNQNGLPSIFNSYENQATNALYGNLCEGSLSTKFQSILSSQDLQDCSGTSVLNKGVISATMYIGEAVRNINNKFGGLGSATLANTYLNSKPDLGFIGSIM